VVWAPEFWEFPGWARGADLMFADAAGWQRPIRFARGVGGHAAVSATADQGPGPASFQFDFEGEAEKGPHQDDHSEDSRAGEGR
jgi:hypothetical protein